MAEAFCEAADRLEGAEDFDMAVHDLIKEYMTEHQRIIFNGNGYAREWEEEAARRGLPNIPSMVAAVDTLTTPKAIHLFEKFGIFTEAELRSRAEVLYLSLIHIWVQQMKQLLKENSKWKNVGWFFRILFMIFALTPGCLTTLSDGLDGLHVEMVFLTMGVGAVCWITKDESLRKNRWLHVLCA